MPRFHVIVLRLAMIGLLAGCQVVPRPFAEDRPPPNGPMLTVADSFGVIVGPVQNAPEAAGQQLAQGMAAGLRDQEIPASTDVGNKHSFRLSGDAGSSTIGASRAAIVIHWTLRDRDGKTIGEDLQKAELPAAQWQSGAAPGLADLGKAEAARFVPLMVEAPPVEVKTGRTVFVRAVTGAPGDGGTSLPRAMSFVLQKAELTVTPDAKTPGVVVIDGTVVVKPVPPKEQHVLIDWIVYKPDGSEAGRIKQENTIPGGSLDGQWGDIAMAIASAAADGIVAVVKTLPAEPRPGS